MAEHVDGSIVVDTELDSEGFQAGSSELQKAVKSLNTKMQALGPTFQKALSGNQSAITAFDAKAAALKKTISEIETKMTDLGNQKVPTAIYTKMRADAQKQLAQVEKSITSLNTKLEAAKAKLSDYYREQTAIKESTDEMLKGARSSEQTENILGIEKAELDALNAKYAKQLQTVKQIEKSLELQRKNQADIQKNLAYQPTEADGTAFQMGVDTAEYAQLKSALAEANRELADMQQSAAMAKGGLAGVLATMRSAAPISAQFKSVFDGIKTKITSTVASFKNAGETLKNAITHPIKTINQGLGSAISGLKNLGKQAIKSVGGLCKKAFTATVNAIRSFRKESGNGGNAITKLGKKITGLGTMLNRMIIYKAFSAMITGVKDGLNNLAQYSGSVNKSISVLKSGLTQLKNSFATAFAPILTTVVPILSKLIGYLSSAVTYIGKLFSALTGAKTFTKATTVQEDYAASLDSTSKSAKNAQKSLLGFDEINSLSDNSTSGDGDGSASVSEMFEEIPIESKITDFINRLKAAFQNGEYAEIGKIIGTKINEAVQKINDFVSWENVGETVTKVVQGVAQGFNSLIYTIDWQLIGDTIAQGVNSVINTLYLLITEIDWPAIAAGLANGLNGVIYGIDWEKLGTTLSTGFRTVLATLRRAVTTFDWNALGEGIADAVNNIDWAGILGDLAGLVSDLLVAALDLLIGFIDEIDWDKLGQDLWNGLVALVENIDWSALIEKCFHLLGSVIGGQQSLLNGFGAAIWESLKQGFESTKSYFNEYIEKAGGNVIEGLWNGILDALKNVGNWIIENIWKPFSEGFANAFGIHSPSTKMAEFGRFIIQGLLNGIKQTWSTVTKFFSTTLDSLKTSISNGWDSIKSNASTVWSNIKTTVSEKWSSLKDTISQNNEKIKSNISSAWGNMKSTVSTKLSEISSSASSTFSTLKNNATTWGKDLCANMAEGIRKATSKVGDAVTGVANKIKSLLGFSEPEDGPLSNFHTYMPDMIDLMTEGIRKNQGTAIGAVSQMADSIAQEIQNGDYNLGKIGSDGSFSSVLTDFSDKIVDGFNSLLSRLQAIADGVTFTVPAVATGGVVPYSIASGTSGGAFIGMFDNDELTDATKSIENTAFEQIALLREQNGYLRKILDKDTNAPSSISTNDVVSLFALKNKRDGRTTVSVHE